MTSFRLAKFVLPLRVVVLSFWIAFGVFGSIKSIVVGVGSKSPDVPVYSCFRPVLFEDLDAKVVNLAEDMPDSRPNNVSGVTCASDAGEEVKVDFFIFH